MLFIKSVDFDIALDRAHGIALMQTVQATLDKLSKFINRDENTDKEISVYDLREAKLKYNPLFKMHYIGYGLFDKRNYRKYTYRTFRISKMYRIFRVFLSKNKKLSEATSIIFDKSSQPTSSSSIMLLANTIYCKDYKNDIYGNRFEVYIVNERDYFTLLYKNGDIRLFVKNVIKEHNIKKIEIPMIFRNYLVE